MLFSWSIILCVFIIPLEDDLGSVKSTFVKLFCVLPVGNHVYM